MQWPFYNQTLRLREIHYPTKWLHLLSCGTFAAPSDARTKHKYFYRFASGYLLSTLTKLDDSRRRTVAMETGCQNGQLGCAVLKVAFPNQLIGSFFLFPLLYSVFQLTEGLLLIALTQLRQRREESRPTVKCTLDAKTRIKTISLHVWNRLKKTGYPPHTEKLTEAPSTSFTTSPGKEPESSSTSITSDESSSQQAGAVVNHSFEKEADV